MNTPYVCMSVNDDAPPAMRAYWSDRDNAREQYVTLNVGQVSLYIEPGQLDRLINLLQLTREQRPDDGKRPCSFCRGEHGSEIVHACE